MLDSRGWSGIIEDHADADPAAVDALIYALAHALGGHNPTQTVALARNLQPGSAIKRVMRARQLGYLGKATKGRSGGLTNGNLRLTSAERGVVRSWHSSGPTTWSSTSPGTSGKGDHPGKTELPVT